MRTARARRGIGAPALQVISARLVLGAVIGVLLAAVGAPVAHAQGAPPAAGGDSTAIPGEIRHAWLRVDTVPPGLLVFVDGDPVGRSPLDSIPFEPGIVHVRVRRDDARRFDRESDERTLTLRPGELSRVSLDLRAPVALESVPEGAEVFSGEGASAAPSASVGETPLRLAPAILAERTFRLSSAGFADSVLPGASILALAERHGTATVALRRTAPLLLEQERGRSFFKRRWVQWGLVAVGAGLTGASALLKHQGDLWYDRYLDSSDRRVLDTYFDRAVHYDHLSLVSLGIGQAVFTGGLVLLVSGSAP